MPEHRWSLLCHRGVVDKYTNLLSIIEVLDEGTADEPPADAAPEDISVTINGQLISLWARSEPSKPETFWQRVTITTPEGKTRDTGARIEGNLQNHPRTRLLIGVKAVPFGGYGTYSFNIHYTKDEAKLGKKVASVPIEIKPSVIAPAPSVEV